MKNTMFIEYEQFMKSYQILMATSKVMEKCQLLKPIVLLLLLSLFFTVDVKATITHPCFANSSCTANDFTLTEVYLASDTFGTRLTTIDCNGTLPLTAYYVVRIANSTSRSP